MSVINQNLLLTPEGYQISRSVRLRSSASAYFNRTLTTPTNALKWTWSGWVKIGGIPTYNPIFAGGTSGSAYAALWFNNGALVLYSYSGATVYQIQTTAVYRDPSAWYHVQVAFDSTQATAANRILIYVNGVQVTSLAVATYPSQNYSGYINSAIAHYVGQFTPAGVGYFDGYLTDINFIDGQALTPSSFGETDVLTGVWKPKKYAGTYGTNGFYLNFSDNSAATAAAIGKDSSGNGNNWTPNNISVTAGVTYDSMLDVPTMWADGGNGRGNYCTLNPIATNATVSNGNLTTTSSTQSIFGTIGVSSGKWYWEFTMTALTGTSYAGIFYSDGTFNPALGGAWSSEVRCYRSSGNKYDGSDTAYAASYTTNDVIGVALDLDSGTLSFYKNGTAQGTAFSSVLTGKTWYPFFYGQAGSNSYSANFGQRPFAYTPPTGFKALNTQNLPDRTIKKGNQYFDTLTWTGNGTTRNITGLAFQPDLVWLKSRTNPASGNFHHIRDSVRGAAAGALSSNTAEAENTYPQGGGVTAFNTDGFTLTNGSGGSPFNWGNENTYQYVGWQWKKGATQGFDVVTYSGTLSTTGTASINHSLGVAPSMIISKARVMSAQDNGQWVVRHTSLGNWNKYLRLQTTDSVIDSTANGSMSAPTSTTFPTNWTSGMNASSPSTYVAYLFAEVAGFSKFGSYTGNGSADGPFVYCGFRPRWILVKISSNVGNWLIWDSSRNTYNVTDLNLRPNTSDSESTETALDILSNGFKLRSTSGGWNGSGSTYIFAAFAENPFKNSLAR